MNPSDPLDDLSRLYKDSVVQLQDMKPQRDLSFYFLRFFVVVNLLYLLYLFAGILGAAKALPNVPMFLLNPPESVNTFGKMSLMVWLANIAAFNPVVRGKALALLLIGHVIAVLAQLWLYLAYPINALFPAEHPYLLTGIIADGVVLGLLLFLLLRNRTRPPDAALVADVEVRSAPSTLLRGFILGAAIFFTGYAMLIVIGRSLLSSESGLGAVFGGPDPLVSNSVTKYAALAAVFYLMYGKPSARRFLAPAIIVSLTVSLLADILYSFGGSAEITTRMGTATTVSWVLMVQLCIDGGVLLLLLVLRRIQYQVDYQVTSLRPSSAECVMGLHKAFRGANSDATLSTREVLQRIDEEIVDIRGRRRGLLNFPFWLMEHVFPLLCGLRPQYSVMGYQEQRWMLRRYILRPNYERAKAVIPAVADFFYQIGDAIHSLVTLAYFTSPHGHAEVGYVLPDARERLQGDIPTERPPSHSGSPPLPKGLSDPVGRKTPTPPQEAAALLASGISFSRGPSRIPDQVDYCVIGSGAAGGVLAHRIAVASRGEASICVLERGGYYRPSVDFSSDEMRMIRMLYADGGLQMTRTFDFTIAQGECVGGTTVINNAICLKMPPVAQKEWADFGLDTSALEKHYELVKREINIDVLTPVAVNREVENLFRKGVDGYNASQNGVGKISSAEILRGNFSNCTGCGLCNIGCKYMRKLSVLETYIPWAEANGVRVIANVSAVRCDTDESGKKKKVTSVIVRTPDGEFRRIHIRKAVVVAAGAVASSRFLMRSNVGGSNVGKGLSCNYAFPCTVEFNQILDAFDGVQITLSAVPESHEAIFETYFNPPGAYSISLSQYFERHAEMMQAYRRSVNFGALVGSDPSGSVSPRRDLLSGRAIQWNQTNSEIARIKRALSTVIHIAKASGAVQITLPTHPALRLSLDAETDRVVGDFSRLLNDKGDFNFFTAHPQGGNMMAAQTFDERVVDPDFRVRDCENLFVCDASVFPRGIHVNPQWTIMALASAAAEHIR